MTVIEVVAEGVPAGLGAPIYAKLDSDLASAMMSINAVKGVEIGEGMAAAALRGTENLARHVENLRKFGLEPVIALNRFPTDTEAELEALQGIGARTVVLGDTVLRSSSAGPAGLVLAQNSLGRW
mgnify:CR=1 FL=1